LQAYQTAARQDAQGVLSMEQQPAFIRAYHRLVKEGKATPTWDGMLAVMHYNSVGGTDAGYNVTGAPANVLRRYFEEELQKDRDRADFEEPPGNPT
jgi:hypothetical protein